jgi:ubiquinone/menaquinone biosynthesis C-methylase UbiE
MDYANAKPRRLALTALAPQEGERILDAGCGAGAALQSLGRTAACELYGIDRSATMIEAADRRVGRGATLRQASVEGMPEDWPRFDAVLALNVLYFADPRGTMIDSLRRARRYRGRLVVYVTDRHSMAHWRFARAGFHRLFDANELETALIDGGFARASISIKHHAVAPGIRGLVACAER